MKIPVHLSRTSINKAKQQLQQVIKQLEKQMLDELLLECCHRIIQLANERIDQSTIGSAVKAAIKSGWETPVIQGNRAVLRNTDDKAVFVEFGVGIVGSEQDHALAEVNHYQYNIGKQIAPDGSWGFFTENEENIDIQKQYIDRIDDNGMFVITHGSPAVMYAYNALIDLKEKYIHEIWQKIKVKYWG